MKRSVAASAALVLMGVFSSGAVARGQGIPRACSGTQPATVATGGPIQGLSVIAVSADRLFVLYDAEARGRRNVGLLILDGVSSGQVQINTVNVGEGTVGRRSLAVMGATLVGAYRRADGKVVAFTRPINGGAITEVPADAALTASNAPSVAAAGRGALISWEGNQGSLHLWSLTAAGQSAGAARTVNGAGFTGGAESAGAFGGAVVGVGSGAQLSIATARGARVIAGAPSNASAFSATSVGRALLIGTTSSAGAQVLMLSSATGRARAVSLGPAESAGHVAVASTAWGAFALWPSAGNLSIRALRNDGRTLGPSFAMGSFRASQRHAFSATAVGNTVFAFWAEGGNVQMLRINCYS